jgi:hypothetical protein
MYNDALLSLSSAQTVVGSSAVQSTNVVDVGAVRDLVGTAPPQIAASIGTSFAGLTSLEIQAIAASDAGMSSNVVVVGSSGPIPVAQLVAGARFAIDINGRSALAGQRYLAARYVITGTGTAGTITADMVPYIQDGGQKLFGPGFNVI